MSTTTETLTLQVTHHFDATPERVFDAWLNPEMAQRFLFVTPTGEMTRVDIDDRVGGKFLIVRRTDGDDVEHVGEYLVIDRPSRLVFTFAVSKYSAHSTQVSIDIMPSGEGCKLTLTHEGVLQEWADRTRDGWNKILAGLDRSLREYAVVTGPLWFASNASSPGPSNASGNISPIPKSVGSGWPPDPSSRAWAALCNSLSQREAFVGVRAATGKVPRSRKQIHHDR
jgi:uncharacterized protein YndB with AHSA1/START domain